MQAIIVRVSARLLKKALRFTDERAKLESELLAGIDVVKCAAWEVSATLALLLLYCMAVLPCMLCAPAMHQSCTCTVPDHLLRESVLVGCQNATAHAILDALLYIMASHIMKPAVWSVLKTQQVAGGCVGFLLGPDSGGAGA